MNSITTKEIGDLGESIACKFLSNKGFEVVERNYWKKWGEIDIVAKKGGILHFVEVKSVTRENLGELGGKFSRVTEGEHRPEDNVHPKKLKRMRRVIQTYILEKDIENSDWLFDVLTVEIDIANKVAKCKMLDDIVL